MKKVVAVIISVVILVTGAFWLGAKSASYQQYIKDISWAAHKAAIDLRKKEELPTNTVSLLEAELTEYITDYGRFLIDPYYPIIYWPIDLSVTIEDWFDKAIKYRINGRNEDDLLKEKERAITQTSEYLSSMPEEMRRQVAQTEYYYAALLYVLKKPKEEKECLPEGES